MLDSLQDAWSWYQDMRLLLKVQRRLSARYWDDHLPWSGPMGQDAEFHSFTGSILTAKADFALSHLDDLAVVVLFSVFESLVRERVLREIESESASLRHRAIIAAVLEAKEQIEEGSFFHVLQPYKNDNAPMVEEINQVRRYRNWVAHGKRGAQPEIVTPQSAFQRLNSFLSLLYSQPAVT
jgi:hypothetical protein